MALSGVLAGANIAASLANTFHAMGAARKMKKEAAAINPVWDYQKSKSADQMMGFAQQRLNSRNPMAEMNRRALQGTQAGMMASAQRNVIDPSQLLAMASAAQAQTDQSMANLGNQDMAWEQMNVGNYMNALNTGVNQDNISNQFMAQKFQIDQGRKDALMSSARQTVTNALANFGGSLMGGAETARNKGFAKSGFFAG